MIVSRAEELSRLDRLLADLLAGSGRALVLHGEPGIGKTTLLEALVQRAGDEVVLLHARGVQSEAGLTFSAMADLLEPVLSGLDALPDLQAQALAGALALAPPAPGGDRLAVCVAALGIVRAAARERPVLIVVDDIQWVDASSRECIEYLARRADGPLAVVLAARDPWDAANRAELPELTVGPLEDTEAATLLRRRAPDLVPSVVEAIVAAAAGNPLALVELPGTLTGDQRAGVVSLEHPLPPGARLQRTFAQRAEELEPAARRALLIAASYDGVDLLTIAGACTRAGTDARLLEQAETQGLIRIADGRMAFTHPLIRGAVYGEAPPSDRRAAHAALADVLRDERRVWHLAAAAVGPDERVAAKLERVGGAAAARRAFARASVAFERSARLTGSSEAAGRRLLIAGQTASAAGEPERALALLAETAEAATSAGPRARAQHLRGRIMAWSGSQLQAAALLVTEAQRAAVHDRVLAATMLADAANACTHVNAYLRAEELSRRAVDLLGDAGDAAERASVLTVAGWILTLRGKTPRGRRVLREAERAAADTDPIGPHWPWLHLLLRALIPLEELERARDESLVLCERAADAGALSTLGGALLVAADVAFRLGDWTPADDASRSAIQVARDIGQPAWLGFALCTRARLAAAQGHERECREAAGEAAQIAEAGGVSSGLRFVRSARGFLELSLGNAEAAVAELAPIEAIVAGTGLREPTLVPWAPDLVEAHARLGEEAQARRVLAELARQARSTRTAFAAAGVARCRGMLDDDFEPQFGAAIAADDRRPMPFERARTELAQGRRLHRARRRAEARRHLRRAHDAFERLGAAAWVVQAEHELRAAGARRRRERSDELTAQELRVVAAVAKGQSNREIAAELFLSPKTIEFHLRQIYRKLGMTSRAQLIASRAGP